MKLAAAPSLLIVGDSLTLGAAEISANGSILSFVQTCYVDRLRQAMPSITLITDADVHRTTAGALDRLDGLLKQHTPDVVLLMIGANDSDLDWKRFILSDGRIARSRLSAERYSDNLRQLVTRSLAAGVLPVLYEFATHDLSRRGPYISKLIGRDLMPIITAHGGQAESDVRFAKYGQALLAVARDLGVPVAHCAAAIGHPPSPVVCHDDGVHLNDEGHRLVASVLLPVLAAALHAAERRPGSPAAAAAVR